MKRYVPLAVGLWAIALGAVLGTEAQIPPPAPPTPAPVMTPPSSPMPGMTPNPSPSPSVSPMP